MKDIITDIRNETSLTRMKCSFPVHKFPEILIKVGEGI